MRDYVERFNKEAIQVQDTNDGMKMNILRIGLVSDSKFVEHIRIKRPTNFNNLSEKAKKYKKYKETKWDRQSRRGSG